MLRKIRLKNFRTHRNSTLRFGPGVNGIIGPGTHGKTNILRAIKMLAKNRPLGTGVISRFAKKGSPAIIETDWTGVGTIKMCKHPESKKSYYQINDQEPFRKFGHEVPDQITDALFLSDLNVLAQYDGPFLIFSSPGDISKAINNSTGSGEFDVWVSNTTSRVKKIKHGLGDAEYRVEQYRLEKEKLRGLGRVKRLIREVKFFNEKRVALEEDVEEISEIYNRWLGYQKKVRFHKKIMRLQRNVDRIKKILEQIKSYDDEIGLIDDYLSKKIQIKELVKMHKGNVRKYAKLLAKERSCPTCKSPIKQSTIRRLKQEVKLPIN